MNAPYISGPTYACDLTITAFQAMSAALLQATGLPITTLCIGPLDVAVAYTCITQSNTIMIRVVVIPGLPADYWFVCNERGIRWSPGT